MEIDHLFVFSDHQGTEADELLAFGLTVGSSRKHPGQGIMNWKFYFENCFLEVLWVVNEDEIKSGPSRRTRLWERSCYKHNGASPFGLCLVNDRSTDGLFRGSHAYQPAYFPSGMAIDAIARSDQPYWPWTFRLPYRGRKKTDEPANHPSGIQKLTRALFEVPVATLDREFIAFFEESDTVLFKSSNNYHLTLSFDEEEQGNAQTFTAPNLIIKY